MNHVWRMRERYLSSMLIHGMYFDLIIINIYLMTEKDKIMKSIYFKRTVFYHNKYQSIENKDQSETDRTIKVFTIKSD